MLRYANIYNILVWNIKRINDSFLDQIMWYNKLQIREIDILNIRYLIQIILYNLTICVLL